MATENIHVYRVCNTSYVKPHNGYGSTMRNGGRWNSSQYPCIYTAANRSLAQLEWVSHSLTSQFDFPNLTMITYAIPKDQIIDVGLLRYPDWMDNELTTKRLGDDFLSKKEFIAMRVPSAMDVKELNYIINPNHPDFSTGKIVVDDEEVLVLNKRLFEIKEFVKKALEINLIPELGINIKLAKYTVEGKSVPIFKRSSKK